MERDEYARLFLFAMGQDVRWAGDAAQRYVVTQRRWTQRDILAPIAEYLVSAVSRGGTVQARAQWAYEADLVAWET